VTTTGVYGTGPIYGDGTVYGGGVWPFEVRVEHWDASGNFLERIDQQMDAASWEYKRLGGCGQGSFTLDRPYPGTPTKRGRWAQSVMNDRPWGYWPLNETAGVLAAELTGQRASGKYVGSPRLARPGARPGSVAIECDGSHTQYVSVAGASLAALTGPVSIESWAISFTPLAGFTAAVPYQARMIWNSPTGDNSWLGLYATVNGQPKPMISFSIGGSTRSVVGSQVLQPNTWCHLVGTWDGDKVRIYVNGSLAEESISYSGLVALGAGTWTIGKRFSGASYGWQGQIQDVALFDRALSSAEIAARYALRNEPEPPPAPVPFDDRHEVKIYVRDETGPGFTQFYDGLTVSQEPTLGTQDKLTVTTMGYLALLDRLPVDATYAATEVSAIVTNILDTVVVPNTSVTYLPADIDATTFTPDSISLLSSVTEAMDLLAKLAGMYEYGVDRNKRFYFKKPSSTVGLRYAYGADVTVGRELIDYETIVNRVIVRGADTTKRTRNSAASQALYGIRASILHNTAATTNAVADQYGDAILADRSTPDRRSTVTIAGTRTLVEATVPIPRCVLTTAQGATDYPYRVSRIGYARKANGLEATLDLGLARPSIADLVFRLASNIKDARPT
jgi:Concanavalin A-like lectin/glucanases superfamily